MRQHRLFDLKGDGAIRRRGWKVLRRKGEDRIEIAGGAVIVGQLGLDPGLGQHGLQAAGKMQHMRHGQDQHRARCGRLPAAQRRTKRVEPAAHPGGPLCHQHTQGQGQGMAQPAHAHGPVQLPKRIRQMIAEFHPPTLLVPIGISLVTPARVRQASQPLGKLVIMRNR